MQLSKILLLSTLGLILAPTTVHSQVDESAIDAFVQRFVRDYDVTEAQVREKLGRATYQAKIIERMNKPAEGMPWYRYRKIFMTDERINAGVEFWDEHQTTLNSISEETGVAPEYILGILGVETFFGQRKGTHKVLDALYTLAFGYPKRARFFQRELEEYLVLTREEQLPYDELLGSYAGAMGYGQFMPSSYRAYAVSYDKGGTRDLLNSPEDGMASAANYLKVHNWKRGKMVASGILKSPAAADRKSTSTKPKNTMSYYENLGFIPVESITPETPVSLLQYELEDGGYEYWYGLHNFYVITRYNRSQLYALVVHQLAQAIKERRNQQ